MSIRRGCCCGGCVLPGTGDTLTVSIRSTNSCAGCYAGTNANVYASDVDFDADGDYTLTWAVDALGRRLFTANDQVVNAGELRIHAVAACADAGTLLSNGKANIRVDFDLTTGCMVLMHVGINQAGDLDNWSAFFKKGADLAKNTWLAIDGACGDEVDDAPNFGAAILLSDATEMKVVID